MSVVTSSLDSGPGSLRDIVDNASSTLITFAPHIRLIQLCPIPLIITRTLTIDAGTGVTIRPMSGSVSTTPLVIIRATPQAFVTIRGLTMTQPTDDLINTPSVLSIESGCVTLDRCIICDCLVSESCLKVNSRTIIQNCILLRNTSTTGSPIEINTPDVQIVGSQVQGNTGSTCGAIKVCSGSASLLYLDIGHNTSSNGPSSLDIASSATTIDSCIVHHNTTSALAPISVAVSKPITNLAILRNSSKSISGIHIAAAPSLSNLAIIDNRATAVSKAYGAITDESKTIPRSIANCCIINNTQHSIYIPSTGAVISSTTATGNTAGVCGPYDSDPTKPNYLS